MPLNLSVKTSLTMLLSCVCVKASNIFENVIAIAETLKERPSHLAELITESGPLIDVSERLLAGGESLEKGDLDTLKEGQWLNDKVINAYLGILKMECNVEELKMFVLPSYTAVLWQNGSLFHWMFKKVRFSMYRYIMMPVNINGNHWILMVVNVRELAVSVLDSMHGQSGQEWINRWRNFMEKRNKSEEISEQLGPWTENPVLSNKQKDGSSCGIFTLMNAESLVRGVPVHIMRQVHCRGYRNYVKERLLISGSKKNEATCDMPGCNIKNRVTRWIQCCVCGRWLHTKCCGVSVKAALEEEFVCCICVAMYT